MAEVNPKTLYPRKDSLEEVEQYLKAQLPITSPNQLTAALACYHNTMLHELHKEANDGRYTRELAPQSRE